MVPGLEEAPPDLVRGMIADGRISQRPVSPPSEHGKLDMDLVFAIDLPDGRRIVLDVEGQAYPTDLHCRANGYALRLVAEERRTRWQDRSSVVATSSWLVIHPGKE